MMLFCAVCADFVLALYAYLGAGLVRVFLLGAPVELLRTLAWALIPFALLHCVCIAAFEGYHFGKLRSEADLAFSALSGVVTASVAAFALCAMALLYYAPNTMVIGRSVFLMASAANIILLPGWRVWVIRLRRRRGELHSRMIVVGLDALSEAADELERYSRSGHEVAGFVSDLPEAAAQPGFLGKIETLPRLVHELKADEILVLGAHLPRDPEPLWALTGACEAAGVPVHLLPGSYEALVGRLDLYEIGGVPLAPMSQQPLTRAYAAGKRLMDIVGAILGLLLSAPLLIAAGIVIKRDSSGPVFFRQRRCGAQGREFDIIKLRTMRVDAERDTGPVWAEKDDPRVTPVGRYLRRSRMDEIPQFWNVLKGDMSLVGPRPERPELMAEFIQQNPLFALRLRVRPGLTSLSHVLGRYDSKPMHRLIYDLAYLNNLSPGLDLRILAATVKIVLTGRGAQ